MDELSEVESLCKAMAEAGWTRLPGDTQMAALGILWTKSVEAPMDGPWQLQAGVELFPRTHHAQAMGRVLCSVIGTRRSTPNGPDHVQVKLCEEVPLYELAEDQSVFRWFETEIIAALTLLGRGIHE